MVNVFALSDVDRGVIDGVMVTVFALSEVDRGFIDGVMVNVLALSKVDRGFIDEPTIYLTQAKTLTVTPSMNPRSSSLRRER